MNFKSFLILFLLLSLNSFSQSKNDLEVQYNAFDSYVGIENSDLFKGRTFVKKHNTLKDNDEFYFTDFKNGSIQFNDQYYYNVKIKYDIFDDNVILSMPSGNAVILNKEYIDHFYIEDKKIIKLNTTDGSSFFEVLHHSDTLKILKKNRKLMNQVAKDGKYYENFKTKNLYFFEYKGNFYEIQNKSSFTKKIPQLKKELNTFYKDNRGMLKSNYDAFLTKLGNFLSINTNS